MAEYYGYFNGIEYGEEFVALTNRILVKTGVFFDGLACSANGMTVTITEGSANIQGLLYHNSENLKLKIDVAASLPRKDSVMIRWDVTNRRINAIVVKGTPQSSPTAPDPVRTSDYYDLKIAEINIPANTPSVSVQDTRSDKAVCGLVTGYDTADLHEIANRLTYLESRDHITEQGVSGIWNYRKWSSGTAECWGRKTFPVNCTAAWGSLYTSGDNSIPGVAYPFKFTEPPVCSASMNTPTEGTSNAWIVMSNMGTSGEDNKVQTPAFQACRPSADPGVVVTMSYYVIGKWK